MTLVNGLHISGIIKHEVIAGRTTNRDYIDKNGDNIAQDTEIIKDKNGDKVIDSQEALEHIIYQDKRTAVLIKAKNILHSGDEIMYSNEHFNDIEDETQPAKFILLTEYLPLVEEQIESSMLQEQKTAKALFKEYMVLQDKKDAAVENSQEQNDLIEQIRIKLKEMAALGVHPLSESDIYVLPTGKVIKRTEHTQLCVFSDQGQILDVTFGSCLQVTIPHARDTVYATRLKFNEAGILTGVTAQNTFELDIPDGTGNTQKIRTSEVEYHENGSISTVSLDSPITITIYTPERTRVSVSKVRFDTAGKVVAFTPVTPFTVTTPDGKTSFKATEVGYHTNGVLAFARPAVPVRYTDDQLTVTVSENKIMSFHENGAVRSLYIQDEKTELSIPLKDKNTPLSILSINGQKIQDRSSMSIGSGYVVFSPSGVPAVLTTDIPVTLTLKNGTTFKDCQQICLDDDGAVRALQAGDNTSFEISLPGLNKKCSANDISFYPNGTIRSVELATSVTVTLPTGDTVSIVRADYASDGSLKGIWLDKRTKFKVGKNTLEAHGYVGFSKNKKIAKLTLGTYESEAQMVRIPKGEIKAVGPIEFWDNGTPRKIHMLWECGYDTSFGTKGMTIQYLFENGVLHADHCIELDKTGTIIKGW